LTLITKKLTQILGNEHNEP